MAVSYLIYMLANQFPAKQIADEPANRIHRQIKTFDYLGLNKKRVCAEIIRITRVFA